MLLVLGNSLSMTGAAIGSAGSTITLPANTAFGAVDADFVIVNGRIEPQAVRMEGGSELSVLAISGPAQVLIPETGQSTPLLSNRQKHTFSVRIDEPGEYEVICRPCGSQHSLESALLIVT